MTCYLIVPGDPGDAPLPENLISGLTDLTGITSFRRVAVGMVRSSVEPNSRISLLLDAGPEESFNLELVPAALDPTDQTLTLASCRFVTRMSSTFGHNTELFQTATSIESGRFTVLGAAGSEPYFVALEAAPARN